MFNIRKYCWAKCICGHGKMYVDIFNWFFDKEVAIYTMSAIMPIMVYYCGVCGDINHVEFLSQPFPI